MLSLLISILATFATAFFCESNNIPTSHTVGWCIMTFILTLWVVAFFVRKKIKGVQEELQNIIAKGSGTINRMVQQFQTKPGGNPKQMQQKIETEQQKMLKNALEHTVKFEPVKKWNMLMGRQIATMRLQFNYQLKQFDEVDKILATHTPFIKGPMLMEPMSVAMKMARQYENKNFKGAEKTFKWHSKWFRGDKGKLLYALMSWIHVKNGDIDSAHALLIKAKNKTGNETLIKNWELLSNGKEKSFSNAGLGEEWYGLYLEKMPMPKQKRMRANPKSHGRF